MLHDPSHYEPPAPAEPIRLCDADKTILRKLAEADRDHRRRSRSTARRRSCGDGSTICEPVRPMVWINEIPWHEMDVDGELTLRTEHPWAQIQERDLRRTLYQWRHLPGDMIVSDYLACPLAIHSTDFGIIEEVDIVRTDADQRHRLAALPQADPRFRRPGEDPDAGGHAQRSRPPSSASRPCASCTATSCRSRRSGRRTSGSRPGTT